MSEQLPTRERLSEADRQLILPVLCDEVDLLRQCILQTRRALEGVKACPDGGQDGARPADVEAVIAALEKKIAALEAVIGKLKLPG